MRRFFLILTVCITAGCASNNSTNEVPAPPPAKAVLIAPAQNELCTQGAVISATESTVTLQWNAAANTEGYQVSIKDLEAGTITTKLTTATQLAVSLKRNTPYSWFITSASKQNTSIAQSDVWRFYNAGPAAVNYAPFPADLLLPTLGQTITVNGGKATLSWAGSDVDNDMESYDVYLGEASAPPLFKAGVAESSLNDVSIASGKQYYWKVISRDKKGNTSESSVFFFNVN
jgi:hypothetical protein